MDEMIQQFQDRLEHLMPINNLSVKYQAQLFKKAEFLELKKKQVLFKKGDKDAFSFYLLSGRVELESDGQIVKRLEAESPDARHAMSQLQPRQMTARASTKATVVRFDRKFLQSLLTVEEDSPTTVVQELEETEDEDWMTHILQSELFSRIPSSNIQKIFTILEEIEVKAGDEIIKQDERGDYYYVIKSGKCQVSRAVGVSKKLVKLAVFQPGDGFGEEALVGNTTRNANVTMLTDGILMRMTKGDFSELIKAPVVQAIDYESACELVEHGGRWLDVRFLDEYQNNGMSGSDNVPVNMLRLQSDKLTKSRPYIAYSNTGERSSVAAYLLCSLGFDASHLTGGILSSPLSDEMPKNKTSAEIEVPAVKQTPLDEELNVNVHTANLEAGMVRAEIQVQEAERLKDEVEQAKDNIDQLVADKVLEEKQQIAKQSAQAEKMLAEANQLKEDAEKSQQLAQKQAQNNLKQQREKLETQDREAKKKLEQAIQLKEEAEIASNNIENLVQKTLSSEREAVLAQEARAVEMMQQAERMKKTIALAKKQAEDEACRRQQAREQKLHQQQERAEKHLQEEEKKLRKVYEENAAELAKAAELKQEMLDQLQEEKNKSKQESDQVKQELEQARLRLKEQEKLEQSLREESELKIQEERRHLEAEFAKHTQYFEKIKQEKEAAEAAKQAAKQEADKIIKEYKTAYEKRHQQDLTELRKQQQQFQAEAQQARDEKQKALEDKQDAEQKRINAQKEIQDLRTQQVTASAEITKNINEEIKQIERRENEAQVEEKQASKVLLAADTTHQGIENKQRRTRGEMAELRQKLEDDLQAWVEEQERIQESTMENNIRHEQDVQLNRIKSSAKTAQDNAQSNEQSLFDDISSLLDGGDVD